MNPAAERLRRNGALREGVALGPLTTYKAGGPARYLVELDDRHGLELLIDSGMAKELPVLVLGRGSNLVVADTGFDGIVVKPGDGFASIGFDGEGVVAGASVPLPRLARAVVDEGLTGLEFFVGVPGSVGGAVRQNAGCFGVETRDRLIHAEVLDLIDGSAKMAGRDDLELSYRHSNIDAHHLVVEARFGVETGDVDAAREQMRIITRWRRDNQPGGTLNAGSVFKNPDGVTAGELIDRLGLKGLSVGRVSVSHKHANFFIAEPGSRAIDIYRLVLLVKDRVFELSSIMLEPEIQFVGFEE